MVGAVIVAVGAVVVAGTDAVETAMRWREAMAGLAVSVAETAEPQIESVRARLGQAGDAIGPLFGVKLGG